MDVRSLRKIRRHPAVHQVADLEGALLTDARVGPMEPPSGQSVLDMAFAAIHIAGALTNSFAVPALG